MTPKNRLRGVGKNEQIELCAAGKQANDRIQVSEIVFQLFDERTGFDKRVYPPVRYRFGVVCFSYVCSHIDIRMSWSMACCNHILQSCLASSCRYCQETA